jgi:hypothetical protein
MFDKADQAGTAKTGRELQSQPGQQVVHGSPPEGNDAIQNNQKSITTESKVLNDGVECNAFL